ncbi:uncharacterized protein [Spinacia oleracea]|uniref:Reverse transcriptase domain-containing protein n=1 Tax=Spinacia oleracea TaxID=3562 RepID=A0ABM3RQJ7_SPIOL|nr:uncharacterized protein LOC130471658 [Spinacia oleracea]
MRLMVGCVLSEAMTDDEKYGVDCNLLRGLRQGDPLSPALFGICMEVLSRKLLMHSQLRKDGIGLKITPYAPTIPCLLFADDSLLFCKATSTSCATLRDILADFSSMSGQLINFQKSSIVFSKLVSNSRERQLASFFNMTPKSFLGRYLGVLFTSTSFTKQNFQHLVVKAEQKMNSWSSNLVSKAGKIVLIQSHLEALPSYAMTTTCLPKTTCNSLDQINRNFFWKQSPEKKGIPMISWDKICQPKNQGGLGLRKTEAVNSAFLVKLGWKVITDHNNLWVREIHAKYLHLTVNHFINDDRSWDIRALSLILPPNVVQTIKGIPLPATDILDEPCWGFSSNGDFTVKSATWKIITSIWSLWKTRNAYVFRQTPVSIIGIYTRAFRIFTEWDLRTCLDSLIDPTHHKAIVTPSRTIHVAWIPPTPGVFKLNFDDSVRHHSGTAGVVIRDHLGNNVISRSYNLGTSSPLLAEAMALRNGLLLAIEHNIHHVFTEGDNLLIINILQGQVQCPWKIQVLMKYVNQLLQHFDTSYSRHIYREANRATDYAAAIGHNIQTHQDIDPYVHNKFWGNFWYNVESKSVKDYVELDTIRIQIAVYYRYKSVTVRVSGRISYS